MRIDLHIHSTCSDGMLNPYEIIDEAKKNGVDVISICDHDTIDAYSEDLIAYAKEKNIELICGVEISTKYHGIGIHVLAYHFDLNDEDFRRMLEENKNQRIIYFQEVTKKLNSLGLIIHTDKLEQFEVITKAHIAKDIVNNENNHQILFDYFNHIPEFGEFIEEMMNEGKIAYVKKNTFSLREIAQNVRKAKGKVILAHPVCYQYEDELDKTDILAIVNELQADGIEAVYVYVDKDMKKINEIDKWIEFANQHHLDITVGSDFHTFSKFHPVIGLVNENIKMGESQIKQMLQNLKNNSY